MPIEKLNNSMDKVAKGDFNFRLDKEKVVVREFRNMYDNFNLMVGELQSMETVQADFVSNVSHEFKTPINAIEGYSMLLQGSGGISEEQRLYIEKILFNTQRLSVLVGNILLLAKLDNQSIQTRRGGKVIVRLQRVDGEIVFSVADEGPGITAGAENRIFNKFYQGENPPEEKGNGLGLALAKRIVDINKGSIGVENLQEKGCRFTVILKNS